MGALNSNVSKLGSKEVSKRLRNFIPRPYDGRADLRTNVAKRVRVASRLSTLLQGNMCETLRAWSKSKTGCHEVTDEGESQIAQSLQEDPFCTKSIDFGKRRQVRDDNTRGKEHLWSLEVDKTLPASDVIFVDFAIKVVVNTV